MLEKQQKIGRVGREENTFDENRGMHLQIQIEPDNQEQVHFNPVKCMLVGEEHFMRSLGLCREPEIEHTRFTLKRSALFVVCFILDFVSSFKACWQFINTNFVTGEREPMRSRFAFSTTIH